jgi:8-oxo-dGTP diphosphatase
MKILICGTFCSGKSTLALDLAQKIQHSHVIPEPIRDLAKIFSHDELLHKEVRDYLFVRQIYEEKNAFTETEFLICDAGIESNIAHNRIFNFDNKTINDLEKFKLERYDLVFFCDYTEIVVVDDGFRMTEPKIRGRLSDEIFEVLKELDYNPVILNGNRVERMEKALNIIHNQNKLIKMHKETIELSGCLLKNENGDYLLIHRNDGNRSQWELPGGKIRPDETSKFTAERELKEELSIIVKAGDLLAVNQFSENQIDYTYFIHSGEILEGTIQIVENTKFDELAYFSKNQLKTSLNHLSINMRLLLKSLKETEE